MLAKPNERFGPSRNEVVYELTFDLPDAGLGNLVPPEPPAPAPAGAAPVPEDGDLRRSTRPRRSVVGNQPYDTYEPRTTFLQLGKGASAQECTRGKLPSTNDQGAKTPGHNDIAYGTND